MNVMATQTEELFRSKPVFRAIMTLALPSVIGQIILVIYNMADTLFVGMTGSDAMITAVTVCMPAFLFLSAISNLFGVGGASVIARALGVGNTERVKRTFSFAAWGCTLVTLVYVGGCILFRDAFLDALGGRQTTVHGFAMEYFTVAVVLGGLPTALNTLLSHLIRAEGHSTAAGIGIALGGILNVALDPLFMFVILPDGREALGAAVATAVSNVIALIYYVVFLLRQKNKLIVSFVPRKTCLCDGIPRGVFAAGIPACLMTLCENISYAILDSLMAVVGTAAQAGIGVAKKVNMLAHSIVRGMTQGVLPLLGYNYASGDRKRMRKILSASGGISVGISIVCMSVCLVFAAPLIHLFIHSGSVSADYGERFLRVLCLGAPFSAFAYTVISFFQAVGKGNRSLLLALLRKGILDIPLMYLLQEAYPVYGIVWATPVADCVCCIVAIALISYWLARHARENKAPKFQ